MPVEFIKFHGYGNDYIVIEAGKVSEAESLNELARKICDRHYGAGADGIAVVSRAEINEADFHVRIFNPDGSEAGLSGNGTRCAAAYLYYSHLWSADELGLNTRSGVKRYFLRFSASHEMYHRGQLTVYERLMNIKPALTTRFEKLFAQRAGGAAE